MLFNILLFLQSNKKLIIRVHHIINFSRSSIKNEINDVISSKSDPMDNPLKNTPHTASQTTSNEWVHIYSLQQAAYPAPWLKEYKYWPTMGRIDNAFGDRNLICPCPPPVRYED